MITIALEPYYCGGAEECKHILRKISLYLNGYLDIDIEKRVIDTFSANLEIDHQ